MRVKGIVSLLTFILISSALPQVASAADLPSFEIKSVSSTMIDPGDTVTWKIQVNLVPGWVKYFGLNIRTPNGDVRTLTALVDPKYDIKIATSKEIILDLKTNSYDLAGKYKILYGYIANVKEYYAYDPVNAKEYASNGYMVAQNMNQFDFTIRDSGSGIQKTPQLIESVGFEKSQVDPGSRSDLQIKTSGTGLLVSVSVQIATPDGNISAYCDATMQDEPSSCKDLINNNGKYSFSIPIWTAEDNSPGTYKITQINIGYKNGVGQQFSNDTASWGGSVVYEESENVYDGVKAQKLSQFPQNGLSFKLLDAGQGTAQAPIWTNLAWKERAVKAGSIATLVISVNGFSRNIGSIGIRSLATTLLNGDDVMVFTNQNKSDQVVRKINQVKDSDAKSGTFEVEVYIPRNAKPGSYGIGDLLLWSTSCKLPAVNTINIVSSANNINCQSSPNGWYTSFSMGNLFSGLTSSGNKGKPWTGYVNPISVKIDVTAAAPLEAPKVEVIDVSSSSVEFQYLYSGEQSCAGSVNIGDLVEDKIQNNYRILKVINLKPESPVTLKLSCTDTTGAKTESNLTTKTAKPIPPASPKFTLDSVTTDSATFSITIREDFKYSVIVESGEAQILGNKESGFKVQVTGLKPGIKTNLVATITDTFGQSTSSEPFYFAADLPLKPQKPNLASGKVTTSSVEFKYEKLPDLDYELTVSEGEVSDVRGSVVVSGLAPNTQISATLVVTDQYGQSTTSDQLFLMSAIPELPSLPTLYLVKSSSNSITLKYGTRPGMKFFAKATSGSLVNSNGSIVISGLKPSQKIEVSLSMFDNYGQSRTSDFYTFSTTVAAKTPLKTTITCVKGKTSKVITGVKPTCPTGFTKK